QSMALTLTPGTLIVASAYPDPPFDLIENGSASGFDIELMRAICAQLGLALRPVRYSGSDFNGIFDGLAKGSYDAVISGTTMTPERSVVALFSQPYLEFNHGGESPLDAEGRVARRSAWPDGPHPIGKHLRRCRQAPVGGGRDRRHQILSLSRHRDRPRRPRGRAHRSGDQALPGDLVVGEGSSGVGGRDRGADP